MGARVRGLSRAAGGFDWMFIESETPLFTSLFLMWWSSAGLKIGNPGMQIVPLFRTLERFDRLNGGDQDRVVSIAVRVSIARDGAR
jgi:hypothetical protein